MTRLQKHLLSSKIFNASALPKFYSKYNSCLHFMIGYENRFNDIHKSIPIKLFQLKAFSQPKCPKHNRLHQVALNFSVISSDMGMTLATRLHYTDDWLACPVYRSHYIKPMKGNSRSYVALATWLRKETVTTGSMIPQIRWNRNANWKCVRGAGSNFSITSMSHCWKVITHFSIIMTYTLSVNLNVTLLMSITLPLCLS